MIAKRKIRKDNKEEVINYRDYVKRFFKKEVVTIVVREKKENWWGAVDCYDEEGVRIITLIFNYYDTNLDAYYGQGRYCKFFIEKEEFVENTCK